MTTVDCVAEFHCITSSARTRDVLRSMGEFRTKRDGRHFTSPLDHGQEKHFRIASSTIKNLHEGAVQVACGFLNADVRVAASRHATCTALGGVRRKQAHCGPDRSGQSSRPPAHASGEARGVNCAPSGFGLIDQRSMFSPVVAACDQLERASSSRLYRSS